MGKIFDFINKPLGFVLENLADLFGGSFAWAVLVFTVLINLVLVPLTIKSQKSTVQQTRIKPKLDALKKRYGDDKQKYNEAMQKLYQDEGVSMSGGCLPMLLRLLLMMCIYTLILSPLTYMVGAKSNDINTVNTAISSSLAELKKSDEDEYNKFISKYGWQEGRSELSLVNIIRADDYNNYEKALTELLGKKKYGKIEKALDAIVKKDKEKEIDFKFVSSKINLTETPKFSLDFTKAKPIWIMPLLAFVAQILSSLLSMAIQKKNNPEAPSMMGMMLTMPLISLFIGFGLPGGVSFYWACSSIIGGAIQVAVQYVYGPHKMLSATRAKELSKQCDFEAGQIEKLSSNKD